MLKLANYAISIAMATYVGQLFLDELLPMLNQSIMVISNFPVQ